MGKDWNTPEELAVDAAAFLKVSYGVIGFYFWEFIISLDFDWEYLTGKRRFRWPMIFYFINRYIALVVMASLAASLSLTKEIHCAPFYTFMGVAGNMCGGLASINLSIRTMAIWSQSRYIVIPLVLLILGQWSIIVQGTQLTASWVEGQGCVIVRTGNTILTVFFSYSLCLDSIVLILAAWKLFFASAARSHSRLVKLLFRDGLIYFLVAFLSNIVVVVFERLQLNPIMSVIFSVPSMIMCATAATRAVRNLAKHVQSGGVDIYGVTKLEYARPSTGNIHFPSAQTPNVSINKSNNDGVRIHMDTFAVTDDNQELSYTNEVKQDVEGLEAV